MSLEIKFRLFLSHDPRARARPDFVLVMRPVENGPRLAPIRLFDMQRTDTVPYALINKAVRAGILSETDQQFWQVWLQEDDTRGIHDAPTYNVRELQNRLEKLIVQHVRVVGKNNHPLQLNTPKGTGLRVRLIGNKTIVYTGTVQSVTLDAKIET